MNGEKTLLGIIHLHKRFPFPKLAEIWPRYLSLSYPQPPSQND